MSDKNKAHWEELGKSYDYVWKSPARKMLSDKEIGFVNFYLAKTTGVKVLDIGIGTGRILTELIKVSPKELEIYGLDISQQMVRVCRNKFKNSNKIKEIKVCDLSKENLCYKDNFDFITAIRVLKYNKNWQEIIKKVYGSLGKNGIFVFTMLNKNSLNKFSRYPIPTYKTDLKEIKIFLGDTGFKILEIRTFTRIPDFFYDLFDNYYWSILLNVQERFLELVFGKNKFGRILFISAIK